MTDKELVFRQLFDYETWTYTYLLADLKTKEAVLIDTVIEKVDRDLKLINELGVNLKYILDTHVHADHVTGASKLKEATNAKTVVGAGANIPCADILVKDGEKIHFGSFEISAIATPGHTDSCTSYFVENMVFTGDTLLIRGCGRTDFQQGSSKNLFHSVREKLFKLPDETLVYPAHDYKGHAHSTIIEEKAWNPRLSLTISEDKFIEIMANLNLAEPKKIHEAVPLNLKCGNVSEAATQA